MDADYDIFESVAVIRDFWLVDAESYQRSYCTHHGEPLTPGYYVVNWPDHVRARRFNEQATFHGPFKLREDAQKAHESMHMQWRRVSAMSSETPSVAVPIARRLEVKNAVSQGLLPPEGAIAKQPVYHRRPRITGFLPSDHRKNAQVTA